MTGAEFWINDAAAVEAVAGAAAEAGFDHLIFIPTSDDVGELDELAGILGALAPSAAGARA